MSAQTPTNALIPGKLPREDYATFQELLEAFAAALSPPGPSQRPSHLVAEILNRIEAGHNQEVANGW